MALSKVSGAKITPVGAVTTVLFPAANAAAGVATLAASSLKNFKRAGQVVIDGFLCSVQHTAATTLTIFGDDGTTALATLQIGQMAAASENRMPRFIPLAGPNGFEVPIGANGTCAFSYSISDTGTKGHIAYRLVSR